MSLGAAAFFDLDHQALVGLAQFRRALGDASLQLQPRRFLARGADAGLSSPTQDGEGNAADDQADQQGDGSRAGDSGPQRLAHGREGEDGPSGHAQVGAGGHETSFAVRSRHSGQDGRAPGDWGRRGLQHLEGGVTEAVLDAQLILFGARQAGQGRKPPGRDGGHQDHAARIGDEGGLGGRPLGLQRLELDLDHHHAQHALAPLDAAGHEEARPAADRAEGEELGDALGAGLLEVGSEAVVGAHEAGRLAPVAGGDRRALGIQDIDHRGARAAAQGLQLAVQGVDAARVGRAQGLGHIGILGQDEGQGAVLGQLAAQHRRVQGGRGLSLAG